VRPEHIGMIVVAILLAAIVGLSLQGCEFSVGIGVDIQSHPTDELPSDYKSTIPENCHVTTNTAINEWKLKHCDFLSGAPASLVIAGIGLD